MHIAAGLGISTLDRPFGGARKADRASVVTTSNGQPLGRDAHSNVVPELPPLLTLNWGNNSFTNLFDQSGQASASRTIEQKTAIPPLKFTDLVTARAISPGDPVTLQLASTFGMESLAMDLASMSPYFSSLPETKPTTIPGRQQSSTSSCSYIKRSDSSSAQSVSSQSSIDDLSEKGPLHKLPGSDTTYSRKSTFSNSSVRNWKEARAIIPEPSTPTSLSGVNTDKPLPPAPSEPSHPSHRYVQTSTLPELDSAPATKQSESRSVIASSDTVLFGVGLHSERSPQKYRMPQVFELSVESQRITPPRGRSTRLRPQQQKPSTSDRVRARIDINEKVVLQIFLSLTTVSDIQSVALVNKSFYRVFKRQEQRMVEQILQSTSYPAWELRQLVKREQRRNPYKLKAVQRDVAALEALQAFMMMKCDKICRKSTVEGLAGKCSMRRAEIEDALWRIWIFCKTFGKGSSRDSSVQAQVMWLDGNTVHKNGETSTPVRNNPKKRVSKSGLEDMSEMWRCMEMLVSGFRGRESEAREAGIFDQCTDEEGDCRTDNELLEDWIYDILSVGPKAVLTMISCSFEHAKVLGVTKWTPPRSGRSRRNFLKAALEQVYRDRLVEDARIQAENFARLMQERNTIARSLSDSKQRNSVSAPSTSALQRSVSEAPARQTRHSKPQLQRLEIRPDCDPRAVFPQELRQIPTTSPSTNPTSFTSLSTMSNASARLGATLFPIQSAILPSKEYLTGKLSSVYAKDDIDLAMEPKIIDPTDRAVSLLTKQLGFPEHLAKQALAMSDDGTGIDVQRAIDLLSNDRRTEQPSNHIPSIESSGQTPELSTSSSYRKEFNEGASQRASLLQRRRTHLRGLLNRNSFRQSTALSVIIDREDEDSSLHRQAPHTFDHTVPRSMTAIQETSPELKPSYFNFTEYIRSRNTLNKSPLNQSKQHTNYRNHRKSSSTGTIDIADFTSAGLLSPPSSVTPIHSLGGLAPIRPMSEYLHETHDHHDHEVHSSSSSTITTFNNKTNNCMPLTNATPTCGGAGMPRPKITLTRVGTGKKPSRMTSLMRRDKYEKPEIIGYTY